MDRPRALVRWGVFVLALCAGIAAGGSGRTVPPSGLEVLLAFRQSVTLPAGARLTLHVEMPTGQRFEFPFRSLPDADKQAILAASEAERMRARREDASPSPSPAAGSDHAHSGSSKTAATPAPPPEPMAGSHHAGSGTSSPSPPRSPSATPAPAAGSTHAGSGSDHAGSGSAAPAAPPPPRRPMAALDRHLAGNQVAIAVLPALMSGAVQGPAFAASLVLRGCPEGDHYERAAGLCPRHRRPLAPVPVPSFEGAAVLEAGESISNVRIQFP